MTIEASDDAISISASNEATANITFEDVTIETSGDGISISTSGDATADITLDDVNIKAEGTGGSDAIDIGNGSDVEITLEGANKLYSESGSALHIAKDSDLNITSDEDDKGSLEAEIGDKNNNAKIGSHSGEEMSGEITIEDSAKVSSISDGSGAGIGSGYYGKVSGEITIEDKATVIAKSNSAGAGIGSGRQGAMSGSVDIGDQANVTAWSAGEGAGIGSGSNGEMIDTCTITIDGKATVSAGSGYTGAGIGSGCYEEMPGTITIGDEATVTAAGNNWGAGIGSGYVGGMTGNIIIQDKAKVTAIAGDMGTAIGSGNAGQMSGIIVILGDAKVDTGVSAGAFSGSGTVYNSDTNKITYTLKNNETGFIGFGNSSNHSNNAGHFVLGFGANINGQGVSGDSLSGDDIKALQNYINMYLTDETPQNLTLLQINEEDGAFTVNGCGEGADTMKVFYDGSEGYPTESGDYAVTVKLTFENGKKEVTLDLGTKSITISSSGSEDSTDPTTPAGPEGEVADSASENTASEPLYRVTNKNGWEIAHKAERKNGVLTITVNEDYANLTGALSGISTLKAQGVEKIVFVTNKATSAFKTADLLKQGGSDTTYKLTHNGAAVTFVTGSTDVSSILIKQ